MDNHKYTGTGGNKKIAKCKAAESALSSYIQFSDTSKIVSTPVAGNHDFTADNFDANKALAAKNQSGKAHPKSAVMIVNELYPNVEYKYDENEKDVYNKFRCDLVIGADTFSGSGRILRYFLLSDKVSNVSCWFLGSRKKAAKNAAAVAALSKLLGEKNPLPVSTDVAKEKQVSEEDQTLANHIGR